MALPDQGHIFRYTGGTGESRPRYHGPGMSITGADQGASAPNPRERLLGLIRRIIGSPAANRPLAVDARLSELGITSIKMVTLMLAIEAEFDIEIPQSAMTPDNFDTVAAIDALISVTQKAA